MQARASSNTKKEPRGTLYGSESQLDDILETKQDLQGYPYALNLMFTEKNRERILRAIRADSAFLSGKKIMDYSLLFICEEI